MSFLQTDLNGVRIYEPKVFKDERGYFFESYNKRNFSNAGIDSDFVQDNQSFSSFGTIRGIHLQTGQHAQAKLVRVLHGEVLDVAVDLRANSETFGKVFSIKLSAENKRQLFIPRGFGHGFSVLSESAVFSYKCDNFYNKSSEAGVVFNDPELAIDWQIPDDNVKVSSKDRVLPNLAKFKARLK